MATTVQGHNMPPGFSLHLSEPGDDVTGYWVAYVATLSADGTTGDVETSAQEHETAHDAVIEAWAWYAEELRNILRGYVMSYGQDDHGARALLNGEG